MEQKHLPYRQLPYLIRHFFGRFFDSEVLANLHTDMNVLVVHVLGLLVLPGLLKTWLSVTKYSYLAWFPVAGRDGALLIDSYFFLCVSMLLTGFITVFEWDTLFPDSKDYYNLSPLPIAPSVLFVAKVIALSGFVLLFHTAINLIPTLLFPNLVLAASFKRGTAGWQIPSGESLRYIAGHALSLFLSTVFVFTSLITVNAVFLLALSARILRIASRGAQLIVILVLVCASFSGSSADRLIIEENGLIHWLPPFWFLGVYQVLIGHRSAINISLAREAYAAVVVCSILSAVTYTISYQSSMRKGFQSAGLPSYPVTRLKSTWAWILHFAILRKPIERASFHFIAQTAFRRHEHLLYWGSFVAVGIALIYSDLHAIGSNPGLGLSQYLTSLLAAALILSFFLLIGLRFVFTVPADLNANWVFKTIDEQILKMSYGGVRKFMLAAVMTPLLLLFGPCYLLVWDTRTVAGHVVYVSLLSLILIELLLIRFMKLPFTCSYLPGKAGTILLWPVYVFVCYCYCYGMAFLEKWVLRGIGRFLVFVILAGVAFWVLRKQHVQFLNGKGTIRFEEERADETIVLSIEGQ